MPRRKKGPMVDPVRQSDAFVELLRATEHEPRTRRFKEGIPVTYTPMPLFSPCSSSTGWEALDDGSPR